MLALMLYCIAAMAEAASGQTCNSEVQNTSGILITWPHTKINESVESAPFCLNEHKLPYKRKCLNSGFEPAPICDYFVETMTTTCPPGYQELQVPGDEESEYVCLLVTAPQAWQQTCISSGSTESLLDLPVKSQHFIINHLENKERVPKFWLPARRTERYDPVVWYLPGDKLGALVDFEQYTMVIGNTNQFLGDCLQAEIIGGTSVKTRVINCTTELPIVCVARQSPILQLACDTNQFSTRYAAHQSRCFSIVKQTAFYDARDTLFTPDSVEKLYIFEKLSDTVKDWHADDKCLVNAPFAISVSKQAVMVDRTGKWVGDTDNFTCIVRDIPMVVQQPAIYLRHQSHSGHLYAVVYNRAFLWREDANDAGIQCFTNADSELIKQVRVLRRVRASKFESQASTRDVVSESRKLTFNITKDVYELEMSGDGPGYYYCHGLAVATFEWVRSPKIVATRRNRGAVFAILVDVECAYPCSTCYYKRYLKNIAADLQRHLNGLARQNLRRYINLIDNIRVMKIDNIDVDQLRVRLLFHVTMSTDRQVLDQYRLNEKSTDKAATPTNSTPPINIRKHFLKTSKQTVVYYKLKELLYQIMQASKNEKFNFISLNSTEYCLPTALSVINEFNWIMTRIGDASVSKELCILANGLPLLRKCVGDFLYGGVWEPYTNVRCMNGDALNPLTHYLHDLGLVDENAGPVVDGSLIIQNISQITTNFTDQLIPADVFFLSKTLQSLSHDMTTLRPEADGVLSPSTTITPVTVLSIEHNQNSLLYEKNFNLATILNNLMNVNETIIQMTQMTLNTTNILLDSFDNLINKMSVLTQLSNATTSSDGTSCVVTPNILNCMLDPSVANVTGIALTSDVHEPKVFNDYKILKLTGEQDQMELLTNDGLEIGAFVPAELLQQIQASATQANTPLRIVITMYYHDRLFQENLPIVYAKSATKIISVSIPGYDTDLPALLPIYYSIAPEKRNATEAEKCGYWNFAPSNASSTGEWSYDGCEFIATAASNENLILCGCSHLTHFAYLVLGTYMHNMASDDVIITDIHDDALDIITLLGCSLSIIGIFGIFTTAFAFKQWREKPGTKILLQLSTAIALEMLLLCFVNTENVSMNLVLGEKFYNCLFIGASLQYSILVAFMWMLISAYLQFMRYVKVLGQRRPSRFVLKAALVGWGVPLLPVVVTVLAFPNSYIPVIDPTNQGICYPKDLALYVGLLFPVFLIICANLTIFMLVIYNVIWGPDGKLRKSERELVLSQLRLLIFLFFLLGLSWIFGLAAASKAGIVFSYLFCLTATLQGFVLFIYFIIMDPVIRTFWRNCFAAWMCGCCAPTLSSVDEKPKVQE